MAKWSEDLQNVKERNIQLDNKLKLNISGILKRKLKILYRILKADVCETI